MTTHEKTIEKLSTDRITFSRPSMSASIGFVVEEIVLSHDVVSSIADALLWTDKAFRIVNTFPDKNLSSGQAAICWHGVRASIGER